MPRRRQVSEVMLVLDQQHRGTNERLSEQLAAVEERFNAELISDLQAVRDLVGHIERYRGKMLRPSLLLLTGMAVDPRGSVTDRHITLAAVVEMVHIATLVHDDVLDEANVRRGGNTVNALRGNEAAVMFGDVLISHAYHLGSSLESTTPARMVAATTNTVVEGELLQLANRNNWRLSEETYSEIVRRKTGALIGASARLGAWASGMDELHGQAVYDFGERMGVAFQIIDDVLDLTGSPAVMGKSLGKDLEKGKLTLPLIHRLETAEPDERRRLQGLLEAGDLDAGAREIGYMLLDSDSTWYAHHRAEQYIEQAKAAIAVLPDSAAKEMMLAVADAVATRSA